MKKLPKLDKQIDKLKQDLEKVMMRECCADCGATLFFYNKFRVFNKCKKCKNVNVLPFKRGA